MCKGCIDCLLCDYICLVIGIFGSHSSYSFTLYVNTLVGKPFTYHKKWNNKYVQNLPCGAGMVTEQFGE